MEFGSLIYIILLFAALILAIWLFVMGVRKRDIRASYPFCFLMMGLTIWIVFSLLQVPFEELEILKLMVKMEYFGIVMVPASFLVFSLRYTGVGTWLRKWYLLFLTIFPILVMMAIWSNEWHHLFWIDETTFNMGGIMMYSGTYGPLFWVHTAYSYILLLFGGGVLLTHSIRNFSLYRLQSTSILTGLVIPLIGNLISISGIFPVKGLDITLLCFIATGSLFAFAIFRFGFLRVTPMSRVKVLEAITEGVLVLDSKNRITDINPSGLKMLKNEENDTIGRKIDELLPVDPALIDNIRSGTEGEMEVAVPENGDIRYFRVMVKGINTQYDGYGGNVLILTDITIRKRTEIALKEARDGLERKVGERTIELVRVNSALEEEIAKKVEAEKNLTLSRQRYKDLFSNAPVGIYRSTPDGRILDANETLVRMLGYPSLEELLRADLNTHLYGPDYPREMFEKMMENKGEIVGLEMHWRCYDGRTLYIRENARAVTDRDQNITYYEGTIEDITNSKKQAEMIRRRLEYEKVFSRVTSRFVSEDDLDKAIDRSLEDLGKFVSADRVSLFRIDGKDNRMDNTNEWCRKGIEPRLNSLNRLNRTLLKLWINMVPGRIDVPEDLQNVEISPLQREEIKNLGLETMMVLPMTSGNTLMGFIGMERKIDGGNWTREEVDLMKVISEVISGSIVRNQAERMMREEWQRAEFYLDLLNHDLGNINQGLLSRVQLFPYLLEDRKKVEENIEELDKLIKRSVALLKRIKIISDLETCQPEPEMVDLETIFERITGMTGKRTEDNEIVLETEMDGRSVLAGPHLEEVLRILVDNALKVQDNNRRVRLASSASGKGGRVEISVTDWGPGIPDEKKEILLKRSLMMGEKMMTGLGLTFVKSIINFYGGEVRIEDRISGDSRKGCRFVLELPHPGEVSGSTPASA